MMHATDWYFPLLSAAGGTVADVTRSGRTRTSSGNNAGGHKQQGQPPFLLGDGMDLWHALVTGAPSPRVVISHYETT